MRDAGGFHTLPRVRLVGDCSDDTMEEFEAAFLPNRPEEFFLRLEIIVDRGRLHLGRGRDVTHRGAVEALLVEKRLGRGNDPSLGLLALARSGFFPGHPFVISRLFVLGRRPGCHFHQFHTGA